MSVIAAQRRPAVVESVAETRGRIAAARQGGARIGFVPTMGALHAGHTSLIEAARRDCDFVVVSIFVNPTQFGPNEDFANYPRDLETDLQACAAGEVDLVFHPAVEAIYPPHDKTVVEVRGLSDILEGTHRPGHFRGVTTVVLKLFNIVASDIAYFGQKDYQQQTIIRRMCADLSLPLEICVCPTVREPDGLALSSRNIYLNPAERQSALALSKSLNVARQLIQTGERDVSRIRSEMRNLLTATPLVTLDYATLIHPDTLEEITHFLPQQVAVVAARVGKTRLIDNVVIDRPLTTDH